MPTAATSDSAETGARHALLEACKAVGLSSDNLELVRVGSNAVFRVGREIVARVAPSSDRLPNAVKQIAVARWLKSIGYPAVEATEVCQPIEAGDRVVTFWVSVSKETTYAPIGDVASLIRRLHALTPPEGLQLPPLEPFGTDADPLPRYAGLDPEDDQYLRGRVSWARKTFPNLPFVLRQGVVHGDANVGNVLVDDAGNAVLIDLDSFAVGPREWDLIQTALFYDRLGWHTAEEYRTFVEVYGWDITQWKGYSDLADMREIAMTSWLSKKATTSEQAAAEARKRIAALRGGGSRRDWGAY